MNDLLSPINAAKAIGFVLLVHGTLHALAPAPTAKRYRVPSNENGHYNTVIRSIGCNLLQTSLAAWLLIFQNMDRYQAYAIVSCIWFVEYLGRVLNQEGSVHGASDFPNAVMMGVVAMLINGFMEKEWALFATSVGIAVMFFFGTGLCFFPKFMVCTLWRAPDGFMSDAKHGPHRYFLHRILGLTTLQPAVFMAAIEFGKMDPLPAFGISCGYLTPTILCLPFLSTQAADMGLAFRHVLMAVACGLATYLMLMNDGVETTPEEATVQE